MIRADEAPPNESWLLRGVVAPVGLIALALVVFFEAGSQGSLGPLDLATVNVIVAALWGLGPAIGGLLMQPLGAHERRRSALVLGAVLGSAVGVVCLTGAGTGAASCGASIAPNVVLFVAGAVGVGAALGVGSALGMWLASVLGRPAWILGLTVGWVVAVLALVIPLSFFSSTVSCYR